MKPDSVKVRPIWLSDADWAALDDVAAERGLNKSALIRGWLFEIQLAKEDAGRAELVKEKK